MNEWTSENENEGKNWLRICCSLSTSVQSVLIRSLFIPLGYQIAPLVDIRFSINSQRSTAKASIQVRYWNIVLKKGLLVSTNVPSQWRHLRSMCEADRTENHRQTAEKPVSCDRQSKQWVETSIFLLFVLCRSIGYIECNARAFHLIYFAYFRGRCRSMSSPSAFVSVRETESIRLIQVCWKRSVGLSAMCTKDQFQQDWKCQTLVGEILELLLMILFAFPSPI